MASGGILAKNNLIFSWKESVFFVSLQREI
jgi:hypothetical protein